jgi:hypothetical protein
MSEEQNKEQQVEENVPQEESKQPVLTTLQRRWIYYLYAGIQWSDSENITDDEECQFLLARCWEMKQARDVEAQEEADKEKEMEARVMGMHDGLKEKIDALPDGVEGD